MAYYRSKAAGDDPSRLREKISSNRNWADARQDEDVADLDDYETYEYEFSSQIYRRPPPSGIDRGSSPSPISPPRRSPDRGFTPQVVRKLVRRSPPRKPKMSPLDMHRSSQRRMYHMPKNSQVSSYAGMMIHPDDLVDKTRAAVKIQSAFRGYKCRKDFWRRKHVEWQHYDLSEAVRELGKKRRYIVEFARICSAKTEQQRREADHRRLKAEKHYYREEPSSPSNISVYDDFNVSMLPSNADPNLGLLPNLHSIDTAQRNHILREWKQRTSISDGIPTISQLLSESGPTVLVTGGINPFAPKDYFLGAVMLVYNPQKERWFYHGIMPEPRNYHCVVYLHGRVYISGGCNPFQTANGEMVATSTMFQLTIRSNRWRRRTDMHQARACHGMCALNDTIIVVGGRDNTGKILSSVELYDIEKDQWVMIKPMPEPLMGMGTVALDGLVWVIGGITFEGVSRYIISNRVFTYDPMSRSWFKKPPLPEARAFCSATTLIREIWVWGGVKDTLSEDGHLVSTGTVYVFKTHIGKWEQHFALPTPKHAMALAKTGHRIYLLGGITSTTKEAVTENDVYDRDHDALRDGAALPRPLTGAAAIGLPVDYLAKNENRWIGLNRDDEVLNYAATKIQAVYRGYRTRHNLSHGAPMHQRYVKGPESETRRSGYFGYANRNLLEDQWKTLPSVSIKEWPPELNPNSSSSTINLSLGTLPLGYTILPLATGTRVRRYLPLHPSIDPNLGILGYLDDTYKKTRKILGLRKLDPVPAFAHCMKTVDQLQDDSVPIIVLMGGLNPREPLNYSYGKTVMRYHPLKDRWEFVGLMPEARNHHAAVLVQDVIYVTGGYDPDTRNCGEMVASKKTFCMALHTTEWAPKSDMICARAHHGLVLIGGKLYAVGGRDSNGRLVASIECYDSETDKWELLRPMTTPRMGMACTVFEGHIWCIGGIGLGEADTENTYHVMASVISYDPLNNTWSTRPPLRCPRAFSSCLVIDGQLWLCGGCSKSRTKEKSYLLSMGAIDSYSVSEAQWHRVTCINNPRHCAATVAAESCIYMFGGITSQEWSALCRNEMIITAESTSITVHSSRELPVHLTGIAAVTVNPVIRALRPFSLCCLLHQKLTM